MHYQHIRNGWNRILRKAGLLREFAAVYGHYNPPSTEIKSTRDVTKAMRYLSKYMSKSVDQSRPYAGKLWDASASLRGQKWPVFDACATTFYRMLGPDHLQHRLICGDERFLLVDFDLSQCLDDRVQWLVSAFEDWKNRMAELLYPPPMAV